MEVVFSNKSNVLNAKLLATHDGSVIYTVSTDQTMWAGRGLTFLRDTNPALLANGVEHPEEKGVVVGAINWKKRAFEIGGVRRSVDDVRKRVGGLGFGTGFGRFGNGFLKGNGVQKARIWKWGEAREEYDIVHRDDGWEAICQSTSKVDATFAVPYRPHIFGKQKPLKLELSREALRKDEVFLILVMIYCETKRQEKTNSVASSGW